MLKIERNIVISVASGSSEEFSDLCDQNGLPCYYIGMQGDCKQWELETTGVDLAALVEFFAIVAAEF